MTTTTTTNTQHTLLRDQNDLVDSLRQADDSRVISDHPSILNVEVDLQAQPTDATRWETVVVIASATCITGMSSLLGGLVTVCIPMMAKDIELENGLLLWPSSVFALTSGCTLLLSGAMTDVCGANVLYLVGCFLQSAFTLACGLSETGIQLIIFRAFGGIAISLCLPSAVCIITRTFSPGKKRNAAFAFMGGAQPTGFSIGLCIGGVLADTIGWRWGFHGAAALNTIIFLFALKWLPGHQEPRQPVTLTRLAKEADWIGALLASVGLAMASSVLVSIAGSLRNMSQPINITMLTLSVFLFVSFVFWVGRQERRGRPALIPNSFWKNISFTSVCLSVFLVWGAYNATEAIDSLYFQYVQQLSATEASLRFLPAPIGGVLASVIVGLIVHRVCANTAIVISITVSCLSPLLMAIANPAWSYWVCVFPAVLTNAVGANTLYTISNLLITSFFPARTQGVAGGVYNTMAQVGKSFGLASSAVIASSITTKLEGGEKQNPEALLQGYRAAFWYCLSMNLVTLLLVLWGLRKVGKVGSKNE
ncbi:hypothetical protein FOQG_18400 [Fusarium oxysporum f. sp. raphani 54005]|uniref:Major facilitator superfamily (MFS) profile domain-containing protein n=1 Tax=Fusarium oxysporum f. sp. raphani 54005 TaxID=1089458 RepID=X0BEF4_FUSOX|nr:hypothetical protein FOQG_18400 [Fusarium oxysporum f. sp. raphani 54005]